MDARTILQGPHKDFEDIKKLDDNGEEFWLARELMLILGYPRWQKAEEVIGRAARACVNSGQAVDNHFTRMGKMAKVGYNSVREVRDYKLDRYACYLIAQNGDPSKLQIAMAQTYFATQTRRQELLEETNKEIRADEQRLFIRNKVKEENKKLSGTAKQAGVTKFGSFNDAGYRGLYELSLQDLERFKGVKKGDLLDRAGSTELAANLFRITQTSEKIIQDNIRGQDEASRTHFIVGGRVRKAIKDIGGIMPEKLPMEKHIREVRKELKSLKSGNKKLKEK